VADPASDFRVVQLRLAAHLRDPGRNPPPPGLEDRRLAIYRDLFFNNVSNLLAGNFPVLRALHDAEGWRALVRAWYSEHRAHTPLFPELGREMVRWLEDRASRAAGDPPWFAELAHYEWMEVVAANAETDLADVAHDPDGDLLAGRPLVSPLAWPLVYRWPVHRIGADARPAPEPPATPTCLVIVRDRLDRVGFLETNPLTAHLIEAMRADPAPTGREALLALAAQVGVAADTMLQGGADILARLRARDIVLGTRGEPTPATAPP
jgi:hypothetical protein